MILKLLIGAVLIGILVAFQALAFDAIIRNTKWLEKKLLPKAHGLWKPVIVAIVVLAVFFVLIVEIWVWTLLYLALSLFPDLETTLYYSITSFTTVGYGDIIPREDWRLLGSIESANGFLLFGWSTAFIFEIVSGIYRKEGKAIED